MLYPGTIKSELAGEGPSVRVILKAPQVIKEHWSNPPTLPATPICPHSLSNPTCCLLSLTPHLCQCDLTSAPFGLLSHQGHWRSSHCQIPLSEQQPWPVDLPFLLEAFPSLGLHAAVSYLFPYPSCLPISWASFLRSVLHLFSATLVGQSHPLSWPFFPPSVKDSQAAQPAFLNTPSYLPLPPHSSTQCAQEQPQIQCQHQTLHLTPYSWICSFFIVSCQFPSSCPVMWALPMLLESFHPLIQFQFVLSPESF